MFCFDKNRDVSILCQTFLRKINCKMLHLSAIGLCDKFPGFQSVKLISSDFHIEMQYSHQKEILIIIITIICKVNCIAAMERVLFFLNMVQKADSKYRKPLLTQFGKKCDWCLFQGKQFDCLYKSRGQRNPNTVQYQLHPALKNKRFLLPTALLILGISDTLPALSNHFPEMSRRIRDKRNAWLLVFFK